MIIDNFVIGVYAISDPPTPLLRDRNVSLHPLGMRSLSSDAFVTFREVWVRA